MSGRIINFPHPGYRPQIDKIAQILEESWEDPATLHESAVLALRAVEVLKKKPGARARDQAITDAYATAYIALAKICGVIDTPHDSAPSAV
jgi:hypothetical protein